MPANIQSFIACKEIANNSFYLPNGADAIPNISFFIWPEGVNEVGINLASGNIVLVRSSALYL